MYAPCATAKDAAKPHALPAVPLDAYSYTNGRLVEGIPAVTKVNFV